MPQSSCLLFRESCVHGSRSLSESCLFGLFCDLDASCVAGSCTPLPGEGEACGEANLVSTATCAPGTTCMDGTCVSMPSEGESCSATSFPSPPSCELGLQCTSGQCQVEEAAICAGGAFPLFP